ncbi:MAG TPA: RagB/SusD family nutrient uptake outer membrane protein [Ferruginibacter sp.]|nr:RagB/SusD family nutrient uptake outer membrane protein [Ferruginibacter sp.]HMP19990.1 RagB/SusD family nutrient uptake outer membrane protein [Ferruginibacter sp.]
MRKVKNLLWSLMLAVPLIALFSGCKKFLDRKPLTATLDDLTQGGLEGQIYGLYASMRNPDGATGCGNGFGGIPWLAVHGFRSDDTEKGSSQSDGADWGVIFDEFQYVKDHWSINTYWDNHYTFIGLTNEAIYYADSLGLDDPASLTNVAEAKFMRAFAYFDLVRTFGEVPKIDFKVNSVTQSCIAKSSVPELYSFIEADLQYAEQHLPLSWGSKYPGRLTSGAAKTLLGKVLLYQQKWATALGKLKEVILTGQYSLASDYTKIFTEDGENNSESIFEIQCYEGPNQTDYYWNWYAVAQGVRGSGEWDLGWGWNTPTESLVAAYPVGDLRKNATILFSGENDGIYGAVLPSYPAEVPRKYWNKKVYTNPTVRAFTGDRQGWWVNQRQLRYADVLLMAAEAANEIGGAANQNDAETWLNMIRSRVSLSGVSFVNQAQMRTAIQNERRWEMGMENERFFDLVRWGTASTVLGSLGYQNRHRYYPIPQPIIDRCSLITQNPEWP